MRPHRLAGGERLAGIEGLGECQRARDQVALGRRQSFGERIKRGNARLSGVSREQLYD
ncbi:MAG TPA: hypothetical protein VII17_02720 [Steroidobacteraceae bacterium]